MEESGEVRVEVFQLFYPLHIPVYYSKNIQESGNIVSLTIIKKYCVTNTTGNIDVVIYTLKCILYNVHESYFYSTALEEKREDLKMATFQNVDLILHKA